MKAIAHRPVAADAADKEMLEDLIVAAFADAKAKAERAAAEKMQDADRGPAAAAGHEAAVLGRPWRRRSPGPRSSG